MLGAGNIIEGDGVMDGAGQIKLDTGGTGLQPVGGAVIQGDPVGKDVVGIEALDEIGGLFGGGEPVLALDLPHLGLIAGPKGNIGIQRQAGQEVLIIRQMGGIDGNGGNARIK